MMMFRKFLALALTLAAVDSRVSNQRLRGPQFEELKRQLSNPKLSDKIKGKSLAQLGVKPESSVRQGQRRQEADGVVKFFAIYNEFGPSVSTLGESAGLNGYIFDFSNYGSADLSEDDIVGALRGTCSVVGGDGGEDHFCTYEIMISSNLFTTYDEKGFGTVVASGSLTYDVDDGGYLIVEGLGDDFEHQEQGGILTLTYKATGANNVVVGELALS